MFQTLKNAWKIPELRKKLIFTFLVIVLYRIGAQLPVPWFNATNTLDFQGTSFYMLELFSGGALSRASLFALGVSPYITASIVIQLLTIAIPKFEAWSKEGEAGKKKLTMVTRFVTVGLALVTSIGYTMYLRNPQVNMLTYNANSKGYIFKDIVIILCYVAGAALVMWIAEKINEHGIGNGISIILFANIIAGMPTTAYSLWQYCIYGDINRVAGIALLVGVVVIVLVATLAVIWFTNSERRIPIQYAKRVVGRKMYGGQSTHLPLKLDMSGVMPVIFASSIVGILPTIAGFVPDSGFGKFVNNYLGHTSFPYIAFYFILVIAFAYFYIMISFNPVEVSNNLRNNGGAIPGIRPGKPTVDYITKILRRITLMGALFLCIIAGIPMIVYAVWYAIDMVGANAIAGLAFGGTSLLIVVGVALETFRELEAQMTLRNYKGFLD